jgi:RNA polymerase sigma factor (sigma-70 family)
LDGLVAAAASGDQVAFARIVAAHHEDMIRVCYVITRDVDAAQDAVQEAWTIAWRGLKRLKDPSRVRQWLVAIAANEARQFLRGQRRRVVTEIRAETSRDDEEGTQGWSGSMDLRNALAHLSVQDRQLLSLRYVAGFDSGELSRITGLSPSGTRARLQRLLATLRVQLEPPNA